MSEFIPHTVYAGNLKLSQYRLASYLSENIVKAYQGEIKDPPISLHLNQTGNILYAITGDGHWQEKTKELFDAVTVFFTAMTKVLSNKNKSLMDYDAVTKLIRTCGFFTEIQKYEERYEIKRTSTPINEQIIAQLLPGLTTNAGLTIAKTVLSQLGQNLKNQQNSNSKVCHLLFVCEEIFGEPCVTTFVYYVSKGSLPWIADTECNQESRREMRAEQIADTFLLITPEKIKQYVDQFMEENPEKDKLIEVLTNLVD